MDRTKVFVFNCKLRKLLKFIQINDDGYTLSFALIAANL